MKALITVLSLILVGTTSQAADFPVGKYECTVGTSVSIWEISESADHLPMVTYTGLGPAGKTVSEGLATIRKTYDAAGAVIRANLIFAPTSASLLFDANGPTDPNCVKK